jgi:hypothetical protein
MAKLKLLELRCRETEDSGGDEAYLTVNGNKVWATEGISSGETASLRSVPIINFDKKAVIALWDQDSGLFDSDDNLGKFVVSDKEAGQDERDFNFKKDGADYLLIYKVEK